QHAKAVVFQRPRSVLARAAAAEVVAREQDLRAVVARLVEHEVGVERTLAVVRAGLADVEVAPLVEGVGAEPATLDRLQELLRDDRVGVDVGAVERRDQAVELGKRIHYFTALWMASPPASMSRPTPCTVLQAMETKPATSAAAISASFFIAFSSVRNARSERTHVGEVARHRGGGG